MALDTEDVQPAHIGHPLAQDYVRPPARHVGGNGNPAPLPGMGYDFRLPLVMLCVQDFMFSSLALQHL